MIHGHHYKGYDHPLEVLWICIYCHNELESDSRRRFGSDNYNSKLSDNEVESIRQMLEAGIRKQVIANNFQISLRTVYSILNGEVYA